MDALDKESLVKRFLDKQLSAEEEAAFLKSLDADESLKFELDAEKAARVAFGFLEDELIREELGDLFEVNQKKRRWKRWLIGVLSIVFVGSIAVYMVLPSNPNLFHRELKVFCDKFDSSSKGTKPKPQNPKGTDSVSSTLCISIKNKQYQEVIKIISEAIASDIDNKGPYYYWLGLAHISIAESDVAPNEKAINKQRAIEIFEEIISTCKGERICEAFAFDKEAIRIMQKIKKE